MALLVGNRKTIDTSVLMFLQLVVGDEPPYQSAIMELRNITEKRSPMEKYNVIQKSIEKIHEVFISY